MSDGGGAGRHAMCGARRAGGGIARMAAGHAPSVASLPPRRLSPLWLPRRPTAPGRSSAARCPVRPNPAAG
eukprot:47089-Chlamydomonas_euryale.AAC.1